ncbi:Ff.00g039810.m01.CDS01 [Fusarium sp. VM40]|nr:Ff.00g039810.m01.CDS01 [Fusarium sp. VM40]
MTTINKVALAGKGHLGSAVLDQLLKNGFDVTILSRSTFEAPSRAKVVQVDYSSVDSLSAALKGHDAVVSTLNAVATLSQKIIIDAAIIAGVKRFIPNEFSSIGTDPKARDIPVHKNVIEIQDYLKGNGQTGKIEYTIVSTGPFLEYALGSPLFLDFHNRTIDLYGDGNVRVSTTSIAGIGQAIAGALKKPDQTKNRVIHVHEAVISQNQLLQLAKKAEPTATWTENKIEPEKALEEATDKFIQSPTDPSSLVGILKAAILSGKYDAEYQKTDNEVVGLPFLSDKELERRFLSLLTQKAE